MVVIWRWTSFKYAGDIIDFTPNNNNNTISFKFKENTTGQIGIDGTKSVEIMVSLKYISNFWRNLEMP